MKIKTCLLTFFILIIFGGGPLYCFRNEIEVPPLLEGIFGEPKPIFTPVEICELLDYDINGKAGYLIQKGFHEKSYNSWEKIVGYNWEYFLFTGKKRVRILLPKVEDYRFIYLFFDEEYKDEYLRFLRQFPRITVPFPKDGETNGTDEEICKKSNVIAQGYKLNAKGFLVIATHDR